MGCQLCLLLTIANGPNQRGYIGVNNRGYSDFRKVYLQIITRVEAWAYFVVECRCLLTLDTIFIYRLLYSRKKFYRSLNNLGLNYQPYANLIMNKTFILFEIQCLLHLIKACIVWVSAIQFSYGYYGAFPVWWTATN